MTYGKCLGVCFGVRGFVGMDCDFAKNERNLSPTDED